MEKTKIKGIFIKKMADGTEAFIVRFKFFGKTYPLKNFTKLYNCKSLSQTKSKLDSIKEKIRENKDPFLIKKGNSLNDLFYETLDNFIKTKKWKENTTAKIYKNYYEKVIKKKIGYKKLKDITYSDLEQIKNSIGHTKGSYQNRLKVILKPIFLEGIKRKEISENPISLLATERVDKKEKMDNRTLENNLEIVKKIYNTIPEYEAQYSYLRDELKIFFYLVLLTAHRYGELLQLTKEDIYLEENLISSPKEITKTKEIYKFPLPKECKEYFEKIDKGLLFPNLKYGSMYMIFQRLVEKSKIKLMRNKKITIHDTRTLMLNIMIKNCKIDSRLADFCLEHKQNKTLEHYINFDYESKVESFNKYWELIRN